MTKVNHRNPKKPLLDKFYLLRISPVEDPYYLRPSSTSSTDSDSKDKGKDSTKSPSTKTVLFYKAEDLIQLNAEAFQPSKKQTGMK